MPVYSDNIGNHFLGDLSHKFNEQDPDTEFSVGGGVDNTLVAADLASICTNAGLLYRDIGSFSFPSTERLIYFGPTGDIDDRYAFNGWNTSTNTNYSLSSLLYNNTGASGTTVNSTNLLQYVGNRKVSAVGDYIGQWWGGGTSYWAGCASSTSLSLFAYNFVQGTTTGILNKLCWNFWYAGLLEDFNTNFTNNNIERSIIMSSSQLNLNSLSAHAGGYTTSGSVSMDNLLCMALYNGGARRAVLTTDSAATPFNFSSGTQTRKIWATDLRVWDATTNLDIGKVKNMLIAEGFFIPGVPIRLNSILMPDTGSNLYVPVGKFAGRTALARFYSSTVPTI